MRLPYACDATLPRAERYASLKFRRYARAFHAGNLLWDEACELVAFLHVVSIKDAAKIFGWQAHARREAQRLLDYVELVHDAQGMIEENLRVYSLDEGLAVLEAMRDGGWRKGSLPEIVVMAIRDLHHRPQLSRRAVATIVGISLPQLDSVVGSTPKRTTENFFNVTG